MRHARTALKSIATALLVTACGGSGGGGGGSAPFVGLSAGADQTVSASAPVRLAASAQPDSGITAFAWLQTAGPAVDLAASIGGDDALATFLAPDTDLVLEFEVIGRNSGGSEVGRDRIVINVAAERPKVVSQDLATIAIRGGGEGRAIASALHAESERLFVIDGVAGDVVVYDVSNPSSPSFIGALIGPSPSIGYEPGMPLAIACGETGPVAVTWTGMTSEFPGRVQFIDPFSLVELKAVSTFGANPVDVDATADGMVFAIACAGDKPYVSGGDGRGYVTVIRIPAAGPAGLDPHTDIAPMPFGALDGLEVELAAAGVRFFKVNNPRASIELTPRSVALSPDGSIVWAACPENDALLIFNTVTKLLTDCVPLEDRRWGTFDGGASIAALRAEWSAPPTLLTTPAGDEIPFGGVTGLASVTELAGGAVVLTVVTGAGPALAPLDVGGNGVLDLPMVAPARQLRVHRIVIDPDLASAEIQSEVLLRSGSGLLVTGQPNLFSTAPGLAHHDESIVDLNGVPVATSTLGARFAGATIGANGDLWLADARRCGLWRFNASGSLLARYIPQGTPSSLGLPTLPPAYATRRVNLDFPAGRRFGGFGGIAYNGTENVVAAITRLPLDNPDDEDETTSASSAIVRLLEVGVGSGAAIGEYVVVLDGPDHAAEGLALVPNGAFGGGYILLEAAFDPTGSRVVHRLDLTDATNLRNLSAAEYAAIDAVLESTAPGALGALPTPIIPVHKTRIVDLTDVGLGGGGRPSGIAVLGDDLFVTFDDGSSVEDAALSASTGRILGMGGPTPSVARISLTPAGLDVSISGEDFAPRSLPIQGLIQPLDLVSFDDRGTPRLALANGGFARVLSSINAQNPYDERELVGDLTLDTLVFPGANALQMPNVAGELSVSKLFADSDGDNLVDRLQAFGARSIGVRDAKGNTLWSSSERLVQRAALERPMRQRSAATMSGIRPRAIDVAVIQGRLTLITVLQGAGLVVAHDLGNPSAPLFAGIVGRGEQPIDIDLAPIAGMLMVTTDASLGRVDLKRLSLD